MLAAGFVGLGLHLHSPWGTVVAAVFGIGAGLTLDEFALWTRLEDVYWSEQGRSSLEAVAIVGLVGLLVVIGVRPFELEDPASAATVSATILVSVVVAVTAVLKGRIVLGAVGLFILPIALVGALRLARPGSPWARARYAEGSERLECSRRRFNDPARLEARLARRLSDAVGGRPSEPEEA
jgi:hypothetical protein